MGEHVRTPGDYASAVDQESSSLVGADIFPEAPDDNVPRSVEQRVAEQIARMGLNPYSTTIQETVGERIRHQLTQDAEASKEQ